MAKRKQTPQVEMPFLDHLEELRWRLIRWRCCGDGVEASRLLPAGLGQ